LMTFSSVTLGQENSEVKTSRPIYPDNEVLKVKDLADYYNKLDKNIFFSVQGGDDQVILDRINSYNPEKDTMFCSTCRHNWSWLLAFYPLEIVKQDMVVMSLARTGYLSSGLSWNGILTKLRQLVSDPVATYPDQYFEKVSKIKANYDEILNSDGPLGYANDYSKILEYKNYLKYTCLQTGLGYSGCKKTLSNMLTESVPVNEIFLPSLIQEILGDPSYFEPLRKAALKVLDLYENNQYVDTNLFEILVQSFLNSGKNEVEAISNTIKFLGMISVGGPEMPQRLARLLTGGFKDPSANPLIYPLSPILNILANFPVLLDARYFDQYKSNFSFPRQVQLNWSNPKNYHFWMAAYLSWKSYDLCEKNNLFSLCLSSADPVWWLSQGYQLLADNKRTRFGAVTSPTFSSSSGFIRRDLVLASYGIKFGKELYYHKINWKEEANTVSKYPINETLVQSYKNARPFAQLTPLEIESSDLEKVSMKEWLQIFTRWNLLYLPAHLGNINGI